MRRSPAIARIPGILHYMEYSLWVQLPLHAHLPRGLASATLKEGGALSQRPAYLSCLNVRGLFALGSLDHVKGDFLSLFE